MPNHLQPVPEEHREPPSDEWWSGEFEAEPLVRPPWWRWVAIAVVLALVVATPFAYFISLLLR